MRRDDGAQRLDTGEGPYGVGNRVRVVPAHVHLPRGGVDGSKVFGHGRRVGSTADERLSASDGDFFPYLDEKVRRKKEKRHLTEQDVEERRNRTKRLLRRRSPLLPMRNEQKREGTPFGVPSACHEARTV